MDAREALMLGRDSEGRLVRRPLSPHLQVYRWQITMALSILHRISGIGLAIGTGLLVSWLMALATGPLLGRTRHTIVLLRLCSMVWIADATASLSGVR